MEPFTWSDRSGVLIARAWCEPARDEVRVRVIWTAEVIDNRSSAGATIIVVDNREELLDVVAGWLARVADASERGCAGPVPEN
jgi:hypothetical protein